MAKSTKDNQQQVAQIKAEIENGQFHPFYLLFGKEHYYIDLICDMIASHALSPEERTFGQIVYYGSDVTAEQVISTSRQYPMMVSRQVVIVKEAQLMKNVENIGAYFGNIMPSTVLVICYKTPNDPMSSKNIDKRTKFYKEAGKVGIVFESEQVPDYKLTAWIEQFAIQQGFSMESGASQMMAEACGADLSKVALEFEKLRKLLGKEGRYITAAIVEQNVGISREFSTFELAKALSLKDQKKAFKIASAIAQNPKRYPFQMLMGAISNQYIRLLKYHAAKGTTPPLSSNDIASQIGVPPFALREYEQAARAYPLKSAMVAISVLREYDSRSKSNSRGSATDKELLIELVSRLLDI